MATIRATLHGGEPKFIAVQPVNDATIAVLVLAAMLGAFGFVNVQLKASRAKRQHSLGEMYKPAPKAPPSPPTSE